MIKIEQIDNVTHVSAAVTEFSDSIGYCEYKIPLSIEGVKAKPTKSLLMGTDAHNAEEEYEQETVEFEPVTINELVDETVDIEFPREDIFSRLVVPLEFENNPIVVSLNGRIDKMKRVGGTLIIQDDKFVAKPEKYDTRTSPFPGQLLQVLTYLNSSFSSVRNPSPEDILDMSHTEKRWQLRICNSQTREPYKIFSDIVDQFSMVFLHNSIEKFAGIVTEFIEPEHHYSKAKCNACNFKSSCEHRL
ncbi:MAG: hypothetical protein CL763_08105 [Chloroflexi bacterium]|nr:hypothetical protein [Chloroflexota bacterium]|tara:strand:- start:10289 stop:11026 length:738 start_codon:yes stop_codon:yes gene_type:complete